MLRELFAYKPTITKDQFFTAGFSECKVILCTETLQLVHNLHSTLRPDKHQSKRSHPSQALADPRYAPANLLQALANPHQAHPALTNSLQAHVNPQALVNPSRALTSPSDLLDDPRRSLVNPQRFVSDSQQSDGSDIVQQPIVVNEKLRSETVQASQDGSGAGICKVLTDVTYTHRAYMASNEESQNVTENPNNGQGAVEAVMEMCNRLLVVSSIKF